MISYTMPCHRREKDLAEALPSVLAAAAVSTLPVEVLVVDYGNPWPLVLPSDVRHVTSVGAHFHMAHARNVGVRAARGSIVCAFVADQVVTPEFFHVVEQLMRRGVFLTWQETFVCWRSDIVAAGGFDERFELYGPEGKELEERLERRGLRRVRLPSDLVYQIPTSYYDKICNYRQSLTRREMHHIGMDTWQDCRGQLVANVGKDWGSTAGPTYREYSDEYFATIKARIEAKKQEHAEKMMRVAQ